MYLQYIFVIDTFAYIDNYHFFSSTDTCYSIITHLYYLTIYLQGWINNTLLFYGHYTNDTSNDDAHYKMPQAYFLTTFSTFLAVVIIMGVR